MLPQVKLADASDIWLESSEPTHVYDQFMRDDDRKEQHQIFHQEIISSKQNVFDYYLKNMSASLSCVFCSPRLCLCLIQCSYTPILLSMRTFIFV